MNAPLYEVENVTKVYGKRQVLAIEHLTIAREEVFCILGPNGAGKSSLLRLLNFIEEPTTGQIKFAGAVLDGNITLALRRRVTTVFQKPILLSGSVLANVEYGLKVRGEANAKERALEVLERVGMAGFARAAAKTLSGGEAQRVALARAIVLNPEVLLLDEPTANLDPYNGSLIERVVADLNREHKMTVVIVTHNTFQAKRLAHRVALILGGKMVEVAETARFFGESANPRTLAFVRGEMVF